MAPAVLGAAALWTTIAGTAASTAMSVYGMVRGAPKPPEVKSDAAKAATEAAYAAYNNLRNKKGPSSTILTGPLGVPSPPSSQASPSTRATLGG